MPITELRGRIAACGFESGHRFVIGEWDESPIGPFADVMWAAPDGTRTLLASSEQARVFIEWVYEFDVSEVVPVDIVREQRSTTVAAGPLSIEFVRRRGIGLGFVRPAWFTRHIEGPIARAVFGVETYGVSPTGVEEWYRATKWSPIRHGSASVAGVSAGELGSLRPPCGFGFSEPPPQPSLTEVQPRLRWPEHMAPWPRVA